MSTANPNLLSYRVGRAGRGLLKRNQWIGRVVSANGREIVRTSETYNNVNDAVAALELIGAPTVTVDRDKA